MRRIVLIVMMLLGFSCQALAVEDMPDAFPLRNQNAFLQIFGLPSFQTAELARPGTFDFNLSYDVANDEDDAQNNSENLIIDVESRFLNIGVRRRIGQRFELGIDLPYVHHSGGSLDSLVVEFHDLAGLSNANREGAKDQFRLLFEREGTSSLDRTSGSSGIGDIQLSAAMQMGKVTFRGALKLPTGDADKLTGSGAADGSLGLYADGGTTFLGRNLMMSGFVGAMALGDGDVLSELQRDMVPYGGFALRWLAGERFSIATQLHVQGPYFDVELDELGGSTFQLAFGADYRLPNQGLLLRFAIVEDIAAATTPDFALHLSIRSFGR